MFFDIRGRVYNGRYFNNLQGWNIESAQGADDFNQDPQDPGFSSQFDSGPVGDDDIPF